MIVLPNQAGYKFFSKEKRQTPITKNWTFYGTAITPLYEGVLAKHEDGIYQLHIKGGTRIAIEPEVAEHAIAEAGEAQVVKASQMSRYEREMAKRAATPNTPNRPGRPPSGKATRNLSIYLDESTIELAKLIGGGNVSLGVRTAVNAWGQ